MTDAPPALVEVLVQDCIDREKFEPSFYRDASENGWVTALIGRKFNSAFEAAQLRLDDGTSAWRIGDRPATVNEISADFVRVFSMPPAMLAEHYAAPTSPRASLEFAVGLCRKEVTGIYLPAVVKRVPDVFSMPSGVARALVTIAYATGVHGLDGWPHMLGSVNRRDFAGIVQRVEYHLKPPASVATNTRLEGWFAEAAKAPPTS